jgi:hypothetical protein
VWNLKDWILKALVALQAVPQRIKFTAADVAELAERVVAFPNLGPKLLRRFGWEYL